MAKQPIPKRRPPAKPTGLKPLKRKPRHVGTLKNVGNVAKDAQALARLDKAQAALDRAKKILKGMK